MSKIIYGICGIGNGHLYRQLPILEYLINNSNKVLIFTYGKAYEYLKNKYKNSINVRIQEVWVPYYIGVKQSIDFAETVNINNDVTLFKKNLEAFSMAQEWINVPDLVISDYEPISAQYAYAHKVPVITIDQQSKYLLQSFPEPLNNFYYQDEVMRLNMFFPLAKRIACSFFNKINEAKSLSQEVLLIPPLIRSDIQNLKIQRKSKNTSLVVYISGQVGFKQDLQEILHILGKRKEYYYIYLPQFFSNKNLFFNDNISIYSHGDSSFNQNLASSHAVISTAGHSLISEVLFLEKPLYLIPLDIYEQQLNAYVISSNNFGIQDESINEKSLTYFIDNVDFFTDNIKKDNHVLLKGDGFSSVLNVLNAYFKR